MVSQLKILRGRFHPWVPSCPSFLPWYLSTDLCLSWPRADLRPERLTQRKSRCTALRWWRGCSSGATCPWQLSSNMPKSQLRSNPKLCSNHVWHLLGSPGPPKHPTAILAVSSASSKPSSSQLPGGSAFVAISQPSLIRMEHVAQWLPL